MMPSLVEFLSRLLGRCPKCWHRAKAEEGCRSCEWCGWDNYPRCGHGIIEWEFCLHCPEGGV